MTLNYWHETWPLNVGECPCDAHFVELLRARGIAGRSIFHFGSGEHHLLGIENAKLARPNQVLAITASREEHESYVRLVIQNPELAVSYKVLFADIYTLDPRLLPLFDAITLFHLGEFYDPDKSSYAPLDDAKLLDLMIDRLAPGGRICFYHGSNGWGSSRPLVDAQIAAGRLTREDEFLSLIVCGKR